jgi:adenine-specific DNA-methyltransferase
LTLANNVSRSLGSIYTPPDFAQFLASWAIADREQKVLDVGIGDGVFVFAAYRRLLELGTGVVDAQRQLYGAEIDSSAYAKFLTLAEKLHLHFPNVHNSDFFDVSFPDIDAVIGNPPYVRRTYIDNVDRTRHIVLAQNTLIHEADLPRLADLYIYFLFHALSILKEGGKLAVITADPWLNMGYGKGFKEYLQQHFIIHELISLDRRVFDDAQVKPVLILATKGKAAGTHIHFVRVKNGLPIGDLRRILDDPNMDIPGVVRTPIDHDNLRSDKPWSVHFKAPQLYAELTSHPLMAPISALGRTRIGLQTLAKDFFVLTPERARDARIEKEYLQPLAQSSRSNRDPTIEIGSHPNFYLFCCSKSKAELQGTRALDYILQGEAGRVQVRGTRH